MISTFSNFKMAFEVPRISKPLEMVKKITKISALALALLAIHSVRLAEAKARDTCLDACFVVCLELNATDCPLRCAVAKAVVETIMGRGT